MPFESLPCFMTPLLHQQLDWLLFFYLCCSVVKMPAKPKAAPKHPPYLDMVKEAIAATGKPVKGAGRASIAKYLEAKYGKVVGSNFKAQLRLALKKAVASGVLVQTKGSYQTGRSTGGAIALL